MAQPAIVGMETEPQMRIAASLAASDLRWILSLARFAGLMVLMVLAAIPDAST